MSSVSDIALPSPVDHRLKEADQSLRAGDAETALDMLLPLPESDAVHLTRGRAFFRLARYRDAAAELEKATRPFGGHAVAALIDEAVALRRRGDLLLLLAESRKIAPHDPRLLDAQGNILMHLGRFDESEVCLRESLKRRPNDKGTLNLLAMNLTEQGRFDEALAILDNLRQRAPDEWGPGCNMAAILNNIGRLEEAANIYRETIPLAPNEAALRLNHSIAMLKSGRMAQGWAEHEWRFGIPGHTNLPQNRLLPNITPSLNLEGRRILVTQEEGLGDTLMYLRYIPALARTGAIVHIWGTSTLAGLCRRVEGVTIVQHGGETPEYDYHCPFISLPRAFSATPDAMGAPVPYLHADPVKVSQWKKILRTDRNLRVGLVWAGGARPENTGAQMVDRQRSMPLSVLAPLTDLEGISFYSLQKDEPALQRLDFPGPLVDFMPQCLDMDDTAALVSCLDLVVSVDTSMVHLAGGLGKPVIMMDRFNNCWRWLHGRDDSPWYPKMKIVRQTRFRDWSDVVTRVKSLLEEAVRVS
ncbi:peptide transporter [Gluconobacter oxydans]|uniref:tetratricopeptide repeat-containing glycosyltransferase family protein n=1 Tax=Gluconobacter thailandicus TaxID=257438 RepID=UPI0002998B59|nr:tetratricopeptide repeat-containing glycosyltransferase family protein [Gluconobacter thailandicus]AFW03046.1 putative flagellin modification protein FlbA [Gluconobacter oxydans H24]ANQ41561.1 peptide transporter [Gluconobacter oxydans]